MTDQKSEKVTGTANDPHKINPFKHDVDNDPTRKGPGSEPERKDPTRVDPAIPEHEEIGKQREQNDEKDPAIPEKAAVKG